MSSKATLAQAKRQFSVLHPNLRVNGLDVRDSILLGELQCLSSYGLIAGDEQNPMISRKDVIALIERHAEERFEREWKARFGE